jgi:DegV family protein with EDD domain
MERLNGLDLFELFKAGTASVLQKRKFLNDINVFPVPDGDTGNNLVYTMQTITSESKAEDSFQATIDSISESALIGARGNSGIIFAQFVNGLRAGSTGKEQIDVVDFSKMACESVDYVKNALSNPVEGTMITVIRDWAYFLDSVKDKATSFVDLLEQSYQEAARSLERTKNLLKVLKKNKVVDSGAMGFVLFLEGINKFLHHEKIDIEIPEELALEDEHEFDEELTYRYCTEGLVMYHPSFNQNALREKLAPLGDSIVIAKGKDMFRVHIHTDQPGEVFQMLKEEGTVKSQKVDDMFLDVAFKNTHSKMAIVTDSIADISPELMLKYHIYQIPATVMIEGSAYMDKRTISNDILFDQIESGVEYPTTATPEVKYIKELIEKLLTKYEELVIVSVASKLSGTYSLINQVVKPHIEAGKDISVIDSLNNSATEGLLVYHAAKMIKEGHAKKEIVEYLENEKKKTKILVCLETFKYAMMGGRVPKIVGKIGMAIGLRPIMSLAPDGSGTAFGFALSQKGITKKIAKYVKNDMDKQGITSYAIVHCQNEKLAKEYETLFTNELGLAPEYITEISSSVAIHSGKGSVAIGYIKK